MIKYRLTVSVAGRRAFTWPILVSGPEALRLAVKVKMNGGMVVSVPVEVKEK